MLRRKTETSVDGISTNRGLEHEIDNNRDKDEQRDYRKYSYFYWYQGRRINLYGACHYKPISFCL